MSASVAHESLLTNMDLFGRGAKHMRPNVAIIEQEIRLHLRSH